VYAELGSTWRFLSMRKPDEAAHVLGKLFKHVGENNVIWGTGLDLVRLTAGPDPGFPQLPDRARAAREARLPDGDAGSPPEGLRVQRRKALQPVY
jgi:hypothetical protein